ncbi:MAG TPA: hypothetical protein VFZ61_10345 [Polyangiales bacterium]
MTTPLSFNDWLVGYRERHPVVTQDHAQIAEAYSEYVTRVESGEPEPTEPTPPTLDDRRQYASVAHWHERHNRPVPPFEEWWVAEQKHRAMVAHPDNALPPLEDELALNQRLRDEETLKRAVEILRGRGGGDRQAEAQALVTFGEEQQAEGFARGRAPFADLRAVVERLGPVDPQQALRVIAALLAEEEARR